MQDAKKKSVNDTIMLSNISKKDTSILITSQNNNHYISLVFPNNSDQKFSFSTILIPSIPLLIFVIGQIILNRYRRKDWNKQFYHKSIFEPSIVGVNKYFRDIDGIIDTIKNSDVNKLKSTKFKRANVDEFAKLTRTFQNEYLSLVINRYPEVFNEINAILVNFRDLFTDFINNFANSKENKILIIQKLDNDLVNIRISFIKSYQKPI